MSGSGVVRMRVCSVCEGSSGWDMWGGVGGC